MPATNFAVIIRIDFGCLDYYIESIIVANNHGTRWSFTYLDTIIPILSFDGALSGKTHHNYSIGADIREIDVVLTIFKSTSASTNQCPKHLNSV